MTLLALAVDTEVIVLGGGVTEVGEPLRLAVVEALDARAARSDFLSSLGLPGRVRLARAGPVAAIGAAGLGSWAGPSPPWPPSRGGAQDVGDHAADFPARLRFGVLTMSSNVIAWKTRSTSGASATIRSMSAWGYAARHCSAYVDRAPRRPAAPA